MPKPTPSTPITFVVWDRTIKGAKDNLIVLRRDIAPRHDLIALGLGDMAEQGALWGDLLRPRIDAAHRILALVEKPGANMAFELGYAIGRGRPFALVVSGGTKPLWLDGPPFPDHLVQLGCEDVDVLQRVVEGTSWAQPTTAPPAAREGGRLLLCPATGTGSALRRTLLQSPGWSELPDRTWLLTELPTLLGDATRVAWVVPPESTDQERDGAANARNAIVAGWALAHGREVRAFVHDESARPLADVSGMTERFEDVDALSRKVAAWLQPRRREPADIIARWRRLCLVEHARLNPFQDQLDDVSLQQVHVAIHLRKQGVGQERPLDALGDRTRLTLSSLLEGASDVRPGEASGSGVVRSERWLLIANPGAGKSTSARHVAWQQASDPDGPVVVYVPLSRLRPDEHPFDFADAELSGDEGAEFKGQLALALRVRAAEPGRVWVLLDGLDEVDPARLGAMRRHLSALAASEALAGTPIVVLTRPAGLERQALGPAFAEASLEPLDPAQQAALVARLPLSDPDGVWRTLSERPALGLLAGSPLMLTLTALVIDRALRGEAKVPETRVRVYDETVRLLLERGYGRDATGMKSPIGSRVLLAGLARRLQEGTGETWEDPELLTHLRVLTPVGSDGERTIRDSDGLEPWLRELLQHGGVLGRHDGRRAPWRFLHRTLREFLAAEALVHEAKNAGEGVLRGWCQQWSAEVKAERDLRRRAREAATGGQSQQFAPGAPPDPARWGEVFLFVCALVSDPLPHLHALREVDSGLARRALPSVDSLKPAVALDFLLGFPGWGEEDVLALATTYGPALMEPLLAWVTPDASVKLLAVVWWALEMLGRQPDRAEFFKRANRTLGAALDTVRVPAGSFWMGSTSGVGQRDERPRHEVSLSAFSMGRCAVTVGEWEAFTQAPGGKGPDVRLPATMVSWYEAHLYCAWVGGRLPTEAEWEYACRAGTDTDYFAGDTEADLARVAWYSANSKRRSHDVGEKAANPWGVHDMHGNVWEWCADWLGDYSPEGQRNPKGPECGSARVLRGGSYSLGADCCRSAYRNRDRPEYRGGGIGFRVVLRPAGSDP